MTREEANFIIDTLECAIDWSEYADDYFKEKHNLNMDKENVKKSIEILTKENKKALTVQVPNEYSNINQEAFNEWMAYKKYKNKGAITKTLNMLNKYDFQTQQEMVDKSIMNEYKGLFEPKQSQPYNTPKSQTLNTNINVWDAIERKGITNG